MSIQSINQLRRGLRPMALLLVALLVATLVSGCTLTIDPEAVNGATASGGTPNPTTPQTTLVESGYLPIGELNMYYEIHGNPEGEPLVLLHGAFMNIELNWASMIPTWAADRKIIAFEQQGHGHTADVDRPLTYRQMAEDTAAALAALGVSQADIVGYSDGGVVGLGIAIRHPALVRKLAIAGSNYTVAGLTPETIGYMENATVDDMEFMRPLFEAGAPNPDDWPAVVTKVMALGTDFEGYTPEEMQNIQAFTLIIAGDVDAVTPEHAVEIYRLIPNARLAILQGTDHFLRMLESPDWLLAQLNDFLAAPMPAAH